MEKAVRKSMFDVPETEIKRDMEVFLLQRKRLGVPESLVRVGYIDITFSIQLTRQDFIDILKDLSSTERVLQKPSKLKHIICF